MATKRVSNFGKARDLALRSYFKSTIAVAGLVASAAGSAPTWAQAMLSDISENVESEAGSLGMGFLVVMALVGLILVGIGLLKLSKGNDRGEGPGPALKFLLVGALLISIPGVLAIMNNSIFQGDAGDSYLDQLDIE